MTEEIDKKIYALYQLCRAQGKVLTSYDFLDELEKEGNLKITFGRDGSYDGYWFWELRAGGHRLLWLFEEWKENRSYPPKPTEDEMIVALDKAATQEIFNLKG
tara:strand:- start:136 stop:444 length:309 start_codon:yes stop_codon:yes gene_type:complete